MDRWFYTTNPTSKVDRFGTGGGTLQGSTMATVSEGVASFAGLFDDAAGPITFGFSAIGLPGVQSGATAIGPASASRLVFSLEPPASVAAGTAFGVAVAVEDRFGNPVPSFTGGVTVSVPGGPGGPLTADAVDGVATFAGLTVDGPGNPYVFEAEGNGLTAIASNAFAVVPAAPARLVILAQPQPTITAGSGFGLKVEAEDAFGDPTTDFDGIVTIALASNPGAGGLGGTLTATAVNGVAIFTGLVLEKAAAAYQIEASSGGLAGTETDPFTISPAAATQLVVTGQPPSSAAPGRSFTLVVTAEDPFGNIATTASGNVTVALPGGSGGTLGGTTTEPLVNGVATFPGITLSGTGGYTLDIAGDGLGATASAAIAAGWPPTIIGEQVLTTGKGKHRRVTGFELLFSAALDPSRAQDGSNYTVTQTMKHGRKSSVHAVAIQAIYDESSRSVSLMLAGKAPFTQGGQLVVDAASPGGLTDSSGTPLDGNNEGVPGDDGVFVISPKARGIVR